MLLSHNIAQISNEEYVEVLATGAMQCIEVLVFDTTLTSIIR